MKTDYIAYDAKLVDLIRSGCREYGSLSRRLQAENEAIQPGLDSSRVTDHRLQALRRKGLIIFHNGKWHAEKKKKTDSRHNAKPLKYQRHIPTTYTEDLP